MYRRKIHPCASNILLGRRPTGGRGAQLKGPTSPTDRPQKHTKTRTERRERKAPRFYRPAVAETRVCSPLRSRTKMKRNGCHQHFRLEWRTRNGSERGSHGLKMQASTTQKI